MLRFVLPLFFAVALSGPAVAEDMSQTKSTSELDATSVAEAVQIFLDGKSPPPDDANGETTLIDGVPDDAVYTTQDVILSIFYHEMGHALIDVMDLPVLGLEEDAADVLSVMLINELWDEAASEEKLRATAGFWASSAAQSAGDISLYDVHSPDERRYFTYVCLWYGASPETRADVAAEMGLPEDRAETCPDEFDLANNSWGPYLDELYEKGAGETLVWNGPEEPNDPISTMMAEEVDYLNSVMSLPEDVTVQVAECGQANAFYTADDKTVTVCTEMVGYVLSAASQQ